MPDGNLDFFEHGGGIKQGLSPFSYSLGDTPHSQNVDYHTELNAVSNAMQFCTHGDDVGDNTVQGIFPFNDDKGNRKLLMATNGVIYEDIDLVWTSRVSSGFSTNADAQFDSAVHYDKLFVTDGGENLIQYTTNGIDWVDDGITDSNGGVIRAKFLETYRNRLYYVNRLGDNKNRFSFSDVGDPTTISYDNDYLEEPITGTKTALGYIYFFTEKDFWRWDESYLVRVDDVGCVSNRSIAAGNSRMIWANREGIWESQSGKPNLISRPIQKLFDGINRLNFPKLNATFYNNEYYLWIGDTCDLSDVVVVRNTLHGTWRVLTGWPATAFTTWVDENENTKIYFGNNNGDSKIYHSTETFVQVTTEPVSIYDYPIVFPAGGDREFTGSGLVCFAKSGAPVVFQIQYALDFADTFKTLYKWTMQGKGFTEVKHIDVGKKINGNAVQWRIRVESTSGEWTWQGMKFYFDTLPGRDN